MSSLLSRPARREALHRARMRRWPLYLEGLLVLLSPVMAFLVLRIRAMAPQDFPDPTLVTAYLVHPKDEMMRFYAALEATGRNREESRVGFVLLGRIADILFGPVHGFFAARYILSLVAVVPAYLLFRRLFGRAAGATAVLVIMSSPVVITAWGTDYTDSAVVSYMAGGLACLAMPSQRCRAVWISAAGCLLTVAVWSQVISVPLVGVTVVCYAAVNLGKLRELGRDLVLLAGAAVVTSGVLALGATLLEGRADFIAPTIQAMRVLNTPAQIAGYHSSSWRWAPYLDYLLVPPLVVCTWGIASIGRRRDIPAPQLLIGLAGAAQVAVFAGLQFYSTLPTLEYHYYSSQLWGSVCLVLAMALVLIARPLLSRPSTAWLLPAAVLAIPLVYEIYPHPPAFLWAPWGLVLAALGVAIAGIARLLRGIRVAGLVAFVAILGVSGDALFLTTVPSPSHGLIPGTSYYPAPSYASALGGSSTSFVDEYRVSTKLPAFVGSATYTGEQLLMWLPPYNSSQLTAAYGPLGMYHSFFDWLAPTMPTLTPPEQGELSARRPAEILLLGFSGSPFAAAVAALSSYGPVVVRSTTLRSGSYVLYAELLVLTRYARASAIAALTGTTRP